MPLHPIELRPGIVRDGTAYSATGGYYAGDKIRFRNGHPEKLGGWVKYNNTTYKGTARSLYSWVNLASNSLLAVGTNLKYYIETSGGFYDITPLRTTVTLANNAFSATSGSNTIVVTHTAHGAVSGDFVTFSGATAFAGFDAPTLNQEYQIVVSDPNTYSFITALTATSTAVGGGAAIQAVYQINTGSDVAVAGFGWGAGTWGRTSWGSLADTGTYSTLRLWGQESFGENHVFCVRNGPLYYAQTRSLTDLGNRATLLSSQTGANQVPLMATKLVMSSADRHLIAFGTNAVGSTVQDPLLIRWCDTENVFEWQARSDTAAGELRIGTGNKIVTAVRTQQDVLVFTDGQVYSMQYNGAPYIFGLRVVGENISIASPNAALAANNAVYWMGNDKFYTYTGRVQPLTCPISRDIFKNINKNQADQIFSGSNEGFNEIWWFYCSANSNTIDSYAIYNYLDNIWYNGTMMRSAWLQSPSKRQPIAASGNRLYYHEVGSDDDISPMISYIETGDFDLAGGENFMFVSRFLPDVNFLGSTAANATVNITLTPHDSSGGKYNVGNKVPVTQVTLPVTQYTERCDVRLRGRQMKMRIDSTALGVQWGLGTQRVDAQPDGRK